ncbi:MAG: NAD(P)-dependent oxidoreductase [Thermodesulfobacteriota bacterium]
MQDTKTQLISADRLISFDDPVLVTGAAGFVGNRVVECLLKKGFRKVRCLARPTGNIERLQKIIADYGQEGQSEIIIGNLLSRLDCRQATKEVKVIYHLAAGTGTKSFADAFLNSVVTTRNLIEGALEHHCLKRLVNLSSFAVYTNRNKKDKNLLDESCPVEEKPGQRAEAYCFGKVKQDELVIEYGKKKGLPYVLLRPGVVYGPGKKGITGRAGIDTFGLFLHFGGSNPIPFTFVDNCAEAIVLAGLIPGIETEVFNIVDDGLPTSRSFLSQYKKNVKWFPSVYVPHALSYLFCSLWEKYCSWSGNQLPPVFTRAEWSAYWKKTRYSNEKLKTLLGWKPLIPTADAMQLFFDSCREKT